MQDFGAHLALFVVLFNVRLGLPLLALPCPAGAAVLFELEDNIRRLAVSLRGSPRCSLRVRPRLSKTRLPRGDGAGAGLAVVQCGLVAVLGRAKLFRAAGFHLGP